MKNKKKYYRYMSQALLYLLLAGFVIDGFTGLRVAFGVFLLFAAYCCYQIADLDIETQLLENEREQLQKQNDIRTALRNTRPSQLSVLN